MVLQDLGDDVVHAADEHGHGFYRAEFFIFPHLQDVLDQGGGDGSLVHSADAGRISPPAA